MYHHQYRITPKDRKALYENRNVIRELAAPLLVPELYPNARPAVGKVFRAGDLTGETRGNSTAVFSENGGAYDHATGEYVDLYDKIMEQRNCCLIDAVAYAAERIGMMQFDGSDLSVSDKKILKPSNAAGPIKTDHEHIDKDRGHIEARQRMQREYAQDIWDDAVPVHGTWGETYLTQRGLADVLKLDGFEHCMRYNAHTWNKADDWSYPALIFKVTCAVSDAFCGIQRVFLNDGGMDRNRNLGKLRLGSRLDTFPVIKFTPNAVVNNHLNLSEGPENALSVFLLDEQGRPVWSAVDANGMRAFPVLPQLQAITLWPDNDRAGIGAAESCRDRYHAAGLATETVIYKTDPNDAVKGTAHG
jgi:hypothetical protein